MNKMKRFPVLFAAVLILAVVLGGCGKSKTNSGKIEITYMNWANETEQVATQATLDAYNASQDKVFVKQLSVPNDQFVTKLNTMASSNSLPDCAIMMESVVLKWAENDMLLDISSMYGAGESKPLDSLAFTYKGKPVAYSSANEVLGIYYNRDIFDKAGIPYPPAKAENAWTWDEFVEVAKKLTKDNKGRTPNDPGFDKNNIVTYGAWVDTLAWMWPVFAISNGGGLVSADGKELLINRPETIAAAQAIADLYTKHHVAPAPAVTKTMATLDVTLLSGQIAMATGGQWNIGTSLINSLDDGLHYGVGVLPKFKKAVTLNTGGPNVVFKTTKYPQETMDFLKFFYKEENNMALIQSGVWMPILKKWYTEEPLIKTWADNPVHPPLEEYRTAVIQYALNNAEQVPWYYLPCYSRLEEVLSPGMDPVWMGDKTAKQAIDAMYPALKNIFDDGSAK